MRAILRRRAHGEGRAGRDRRLPILLGTLLALIVAGLLGGQPAPQASQTPPSHRPGGPAGWLHVHRGRVVDELGRVVALRGFNHSALLRWRNDVDVGPTPLDDTDAALMRQAGMDVVRLPISWAQLEPERGHIDPRYLDRVVSVVRLLERRGLRVVLDMHVGTAWGVPSNVPAWADLPAVPDWRPLPAQPWHDSVDPRVAADEAYFWSSDDWQRDFAEAWRAVAARFRGDPLLVGYDLYNEPHPLPIPPGIFENRFLWPFYAHLITRLAVVDPDHLFIVEGTFADDLPTAVERLRAPGLVYSAHLYAGSLFELPFRSEGQATSDAVRRRAQEAAELGAPLWIGELGVASGAPQAVAYTRDALTALDGVGASGWAWWQWRQDGGWGIRSQDGRRLDRTALGRIARPYLQAAPRGTAATVVDGGRGLEVRFVAGHALVPAVVAWPGLLLGPPRAAGGCLRSADWSAAAGTLTLTVPPSESCTVRVSPAG
jgi:endoglycosylceramidase